MIDLSDEKTAFILEDILATMGNFTINQFDMDWRGNPLVEPGDRLLLTYDNILIFRGCMWNY